MRLKVAASRSELTAQTLFQYPQVRLKAIIMLLKSTEEIVSIPSGAIESVQGVAWLLEDNVSIPSGAIESKLKQEDEQFLN